MEKTQMKGYLVALSALALLANVSWANAEEASGKVQTVNQEEGTFTFEDGSDFKVSEDVSLEGLQPGMEITVSYEVEGTDMVVDKITPKESNQ